VDDDARGERPDSVGLQYRRDKTRKNEVCIVQFYSGVPV